MDGRNHHTPKTRRAVLAITAALAATPVLASVPTRSPHNDADTRLIELGARLESLLVQEVETHVRIARIYHQADAEGGDPMEAKLSYQEGRRRFDARTAYLDALPEFRTLHEHDTELLTQINLIGDAIRTIEPTTVAGLRAHALAALSVAVPCCYLDEGGFNFEDDHVDEPRRAFFEAIAAFTGHAAL